MTDDVAQPPPTVPAKPAKQYYRRNLPPFQGSDRPIFVTFSTYHRWIIPEPLRQTVLTCCLHDHGIKAWFHGIVVMPDHVHLVFSPLPDAAGNPYGLAEIMNGIKGASAHAINRALRRKGHVWQGESYDHVLRLEEDVRTAVEYLCQNPVAANLVPSVDAYPWPWREWIEGQR